MVLFDLRAGRNEPSQRYKMSALSVGDDPAKGEMIRIMSWNSDISGTGMLNVEESYRKRGSGFRADGLARARDTRQADLVWEDRR